jgi:hypothetical protein
MDQHGAITTESEASVTSCNNVDDVLELIDKVRQTLKKDRPTEEETTSSLRFLELLSLQTFQAIADKDAATSTITTIENENKEYVHRNETLTVILEKRESIINEHVATIDNLQWALNTANKTTATVRSELRTARSQLTTTRNMLAGATEDSLQTYTPPNTTVGQPSPEERSKGKDMIKQIISQLKCKADGANKGTKLMSKLLHYIVSSYLRVEDVPTSTMRAYVENLKRFPSSHLKAKNAAIDIKAGIEAVRTAAAPTHRFSSLLIDQLRRSQQEITDLNDQLGRVTKEKEKEEVTSNRIRGNRDKADNKVKTLEKKVTTLSRSLDVVSASSKNLQAEVRRTTQANVSLTGLVKKLHDQGKQSPNDTRPSQNDLRYLQSVPTICASSDITHWKWSMFLDGYQESYFEFLSSQAARLIIQRSDQSAHPLPSRQQVVVLTRNDEPLDLLTSSYETSQLKANNGLQSLYDVAVGDATMPIIDLGPRPDQRGPPTSITGVMTGVTIRELDDEFRGENRSPFVQVFGTCKRFKYVLTATAFIPLKKPVALKDLQPNYSHKPQGGSYVSSLGLRDEGYTTLHKSFMEWTSTTTKSTGVPHPLFTGPVQAVSTSVQKVVHHRKKQIDTLNRKKRKKTSAGPSETE